LQVVLRFAGSQMLKGFEVQLVEVGSFEFGTAADHQKGVLHARIPVCTTEGALWFNAQPALRNAAVRQASRWSERGGTEPLQQVLT
jgi:hypothetical protein